MTPELVSLRIAIFSLSVLVEPLQPEMSGHRLASKAKMLMF